jgi:hypothetical protein
MGKSNYGRRATAIASAARNRRTHGNVRLAGKPKGAPPWLADPVRHGAKAKTFKNGRAISLTTQETA